MMAWVRGLPSVSRRLAFNRKIRSLLSHIRNVGIVLAAFVGVSILLIVLGALLKWRRRRLIAKKSEGLPAFKTILDFADTNGIDAANEKAAKETSTVPVTPPYRPEVRQAQKRNSWGDDQQALDDSGGGGEDYTFQRADSQRGRAGPPFSYVNPVTYGEGARRAQTMDDRSIDYNMPGYAGQTDYGLARFPSQLRPGGYGDQRGGAFDAVHGQYGYNDYYRQNERAAPPVRNRHFPVTPGRAYTADNPYPFVPTGHR